MKNYWYQLQTRERLMLGVGVVCCIVYLSYLILYAPLMQAVRTKTQQLHEKETTLFWLKSVQSEAKTHTSHQAVTTGQLLTVLNEQLKEKPFKSYPYQLQQTPNGDIQLAFAEVPFTPVIKWLWTLHEHYRITVKQLNAEQTTTSGIVNLSVVL